VLGTPTRLSISNRCFGVAENRWRSGCEFGFSE
jgi:hypothetical protein